MDEKWIAYEQKQKELSKQFSKQYLKVILIFLLYNIVADILIFTFVSAMNFAIAIVAFVISTGLSIYIMLKSIAELRQIKHNQFIKLQQEAPVGKIRV